MDRPRIIVLMSVYNGEKYIEPQLDSIFAQKNVDVRLLVRDDGSHDATLSILDRYSKIYPLTVLTGSNIGAAHSFLLLIENGPTDGDYYAFSDADDVWLPDKLSEGVEILATHGEESQPAMVVSKMTVVDSQLRPISDTLEPRKKFSFRNSIIESVASGGSTLLNRKAFMLIANSLPKDVVMHDAWIYLIISAFGKIYYDPIPRLLYRQHGGNVCGTAHGFRDRWSHRWARIWAPSKSHRQALEFDRLFGPSLEKEKQLILKRYLNYKKSPLTRTIFAIRPSVYFQRPLSNVFLRLLILLGKA